MREIIPGLVWIGNARDVRDVATVLAKEVGAVVQLAIEEPSVVFPREIISCRFPLLDGTGNSPAVLKTAIQTISMLIDARIPIMVACSAGMSRSPAIVAAAIARQRGGIADEWLRRITAIGPHDVSPGFWNDVRCCLE